MKNILLFGCMLVFSLGCTLEEPTQKEGRSPFGYTVPGAIYFKNMRSVFYTEKQDPTTKWRKYYFKKLEREPLPLRPVIVQNWLEDEAYLLFENSENTPRVVELRGLAKPPLRIPLTPKNPAAHQKIADLLLKNPNRASLWIKNTSGSLSEVWGDEGVKKNVFIVLTDYFRILDR